jgi:AP endonuclease-2
LYFSGTRLDYILVNEGFTKWFKSCDVEQDIMGSDHCPVSCELFDEIYEGDNKLLLFKENTLMTLTPKLCAKNLARFSGKQQTLKSFFIKQETKEKEVQEKKSEVSKTCNDNIVENISEALTSSTIPTDSSNVISEGLREQSETKKKSGQASVRKVQKAKVNNSKLIREKNSKVQSKSKLSSSTNQVSLISFFKKASQDTSSEKKLEKVTKSMEPKDSQGKSTSSENISDSPNSFEESLDDIINNVEDECTEVSPNNNKSNIQSQWNTLFKPRPIPNCIKHGEPCKEYTVNKPGINQGRRFYLCSR